VSLQTTENRITDNSNPNARPDYSINPQELEFGKKFAANMFVANYRSGKWEPGELSPLTNFSLHPAALVLHYAQGVFEGLKTYRVGEGKFQLFRPELNARRMVHSAERMALPPYPEADFLDAVSAVVKTNLNFVPEAPGTLYIRPTLIGTEPCIGVRASSEALFYIICLPAGSFFKSDSPGPGAVDVLVSEDAARAFKGGTGSAKAAANYALSLKTIKDAKEVGCAQVLFLDAEKKEYLEEMGGMNVFFSDGTSLITPDLNDTILEGVTRRSIIDFAKSEGIKVEERRISIHELLSGIESGKITEGLACGTAAVVTGIKSLKMSKSLKSYALSAAPGPMTTRLYDAITGIQFGRRPAPEGWVRAL